MESMCEDRRAMAGTPGTPGRKWLLLLPLLLHVNTVCLQPLAGGSHRLEQSECCPCPDAAWSGPGARSQGEAPCSCQRPEDAEGSASILMPALRAMRPFVEQSNQKNEPKPLLQPEVGLASSVLETLRQATDEEYQDALARDAARSTVQLLESTLDPFDDALLETPKNKVTIFLNEGVDDMDDNLPEPSHIQETRCIHSPLKSTHKLGPLRVSRPSPNIEVIELLPKPTKRLNNKGVLHRKLLDMDSNIGASNTEERVIQPSLDHNLERANLKSNPALLSLFPRDNIEINEGESNQEVIPKVHFKLRELIDNLDIRKSKIPNIDLKKKNTVTQSPTLQLSPKEKTQSIDNRPLLFKNLLKLKDVELIPRNSLLKSTDSKQSYPNLKLQSGSSDNCNDNSNFVPLINQDVKITNIPFNSDVVEPESSPTNSNSVFNLKSNDVDWNTKQSFIPNENVVSSEINGLTSISSAPEDFEAQDNFEMKVDEDSREENVSDNCNGPAGSSFMQNLVNNKNLEEGLNIDDLKKGPIQDINNYDEINRDESNETFQIEFVEDFDTPIQFDNSSFIPNSNSNNNENMFNDPITDSSNVFETRNQNPNTPQTNRNKIAIDCNSLESNSISPNFIAENQRSVNENSMPQVTSEASTLIDIARDTPTNINEDSNQVRFEDLQDMSDSILSLSECVSPTAENENTKRNFDESLKHINDDYDIENTAPSTSEFETSSREKETESEDNFVIQSNLNANNKLSEESDVDFNERSCQPTFTKNPSDVEQAVVKDSVNFDIDNSEMRAEASEPQEKSYDEHSTVFTRPTKDFSNRADFLNNLKFKLDGLFSTTEKTNGLLKHSDDNVNESSNVSPMLAISDKLQRTPQALLRKISLPEFPGKSLNSLHSQPLANSLNLLNFPRILGDTSDASLSFTDLSDKFRSHTENTIQNVKETLESTLKNSQGFPLRRPSDVFDTPDILESMSNRQDDLKEKLEAIHSDLNDRFSSFQQSILDHLNVPPAEHFKLQRGSNNGQRSSYIPEVLFPAASTLDKIKHANNLLPLRVSTPKSGKVTEINIMPSKLPSASDASPVRKSSRKLQSPSSHTTTTPIPSFIPRPKVLKTNIGSTPKLPSETFLKARPSKITLPKEKSQKIKPLSLQKEKIQNQSEEPFSSSTLSTRRNSPLKSLMTNKEKENKDHFSIQSPIEKLKQNLLQKNNLDRGTRKFVKDGSTTQESLSSRTREGRPGKGSRNSDGMEGSPSSRLDAVQPPRQEPGLRLVEPMKENVPYKCKLICYKDSR